MSGVGATRRLWAIVQMREYLVYALNSLFTHFVRWGTAGGGLLYAQDFGRYAGDLRALVFPHHDPFPATSLRETLVCDLAAVLDPLVERGGWPLSSVALAEPVHERDLARRCDGGHASDAPVHALLIVLLIQRRLAYAERCKELTAAERSMLEDGGTERLATSVVCRWVARAVEQGGTAGAMLVNLVRTMVVRQHLRVAQSKLPNDTFRFHEVPDGIQFIDQGDRALSSISIRFEAIDGALHGLGLIEAPLSQAGHAPTERGEAIRHA